MIASLLAISLLGQAKGWAALSEIERHELLVSAAQRPLQHRLLENSRRFLDTPYQVSPLGEGEGQDPDPLIRYDAVDCLTFVEETIALSLADGPESVEPTLEQLRYGGARAYASRNHLMEAQWLPNNLAKGFLRDVTRKYGGADAVRVEKVITKASWTSPSSQSLALPKDAQPTGKFGLEVIPLEKMRAHAAAIPSGTIAIVVREERPFKVTRVTHLGFLVQKKGKTFLRHAARNVYARVVDEDLEHFLTRNARYDKWRVVGFGLFEVRAPPVAPAQTAASAP